MHSTAVRTEQKTTARRLVLQHSARLVRSGDTMKILALAVVLVSATASAATGQSFDCGRARSHVERLICGDQGLRELDSRMAELYRGARSVGRVGPDDQITWRSARNRCADRDCLMSTYRQRIASLTAITSSGAQPHSQQSPVTRDAVRAASPLEQANEQTRNTRIAQASNDPALREFERVEARRRQRNHRPSRITRSEVIRGITAHCISSPRPFLGGEANEQMLLTLPERMDPIDDGVVGLVLGVADEFVRSCSGHSHLVSVWHQGTNYDLNLGGSLPDWEFSGRAMSWTRTPDGRMELSNNALAQKNRRFLAGIHGPAQRFLQWRHPAHINNVQRVRFQQFSDVVASEPLNYTIVVTECLRLSGVYRMGENFAFVVTNTQSARPFERETVGNEAVATIARRSAQFSRDTCGAQAAGQPLHLFIYDRDIAYPNRPGENFDFNGAAVLLSIDLNSGPNFRWQSWHLALEHRRREEAAAQQRRAAEDLRREFFSGLGVQQMDTPPLTALRVNPFAHRDAMGVYVVQFLHMISEDAGLFQGQDNTVVVVGSIPRGLLTMPGAAVVAGRVMDSVVVPELNNMRVPRLRYERIHLCRTPTCQEITLGR
jgi:uncharacterized protein